LFYSTFSQDIAEKAEVLNMNPKNIYEKYYCVEEPVSPLPGRRSSSIADLGQGNLILPADVEQVYLKAVFAPVLALPVKAYTGWIDPKVGDNVMIGIGAFGAVEFKEPQYGPDRLVERLSDELYRLDLISSRIKDTSKYKDIDLFLQGFYALEDFDGFDIYCLAEQSLRVRWLVGEIDEREKHKEIMRLMRLDGFSERLW
jgi:hypothetical protein